MTTTTLLGRLLAERQLHSHADFLREYRKAAAALGARGTGPGPSRAQLHRWLTGRIAGLPQPHHRWVLETMFPGRTTAELLAPPAWRGGPPGDTAGPGGPARASGRRRPTPTRADAVIVYPDRAAFLAAQPLAALMRGAQRVRVAGVSLDLLGRYLPAAELTAAARRGVLVECLLLDPDGVWSRRRSAELGHDPSHLPALTRRTIEVLEHGRDGLDSHERDRVSVALYDEPPRYALLLLDDRTAVVQAYLPHAPAAQAPTLVVDAAGSGRLYAVYERLFDELLDVSVPR